MGTDGVGWNRLEINAIHNAENGRPLTATYIVLTAGEAQIRGLLQAIRATKDVDSIAALPITTKETIERIRERKRQEELKRFAFPCFVPHHGQSL